MVNVDELYVTLFCALVRALSKAQKQSLVMQLAEILARRAMATVDLSGNRTPDEVTEIAARLIRETAQNRGRLLYVHQALRLCCQPKRDLQELHRIVMTARPSKQFESWRAVKTGGHWHTGFARKMIEQHSCIGRQRIIEEWIRGWEREMRQVPRGVQRT